MKTIYVFGDSHSSMFNTIYRQKPDEQVSDVFKVSPQAVKLEGFEGFVDRSSGVPLAYSLAKHDEAIMKVLESIPFTEGDQMWFVFGEIDVRFHIFYWHQELNITLDESINNVVVKYIAYVKNLRELGYNIHIVSVVPPQLNPIPHRTDPSNENLNPIRGKGLMVEDRVYITNRLNSELAKACAWEDIPFRDVHSLIVDPLTGCVVPENTRDGMHYYYIGDLVMEKLLKGKP